MLWREVSGDKRRYVIISDIYHLGRCNIRCIFPNAKPVSIERPLVERVWTLQTQILVSGTILRMEGMDPWGEDSWGAPLMWLPRQKDVSHFSALLRIFYVSAALCDTTSRLHGWEEGTHYWADFAGLELWRAAGWEINWIKDSISFYQHTREPYTSVGSLLLLC